MALEDDIRLRLSAQRALLTHITTSMRAVSVDVVPEVRHARIRFIFDGEPPVAEAEAASCASAEIQTDFVDDWVVDWEIVSTPAPQAMSHLRMLVYHRCEDPWVLIPPS